MKKELPIAIALLAAGCLLWSWQSMPPNSATTPGKTHGFQSDFFATDPAEPLASNQSDSKAVSYDQQLPTNTSKTESASLPARFYPVDSQFLHANSNPQAARFLADVSSRLAHSKPLQSSIRLTGTMFGQTINAQGSYYQMGQGTQKSRIQLTFGNAPNAPTISQLCDGRFVYAMQTNGDERSFEFVDLKRLRQVAQEPSSQFSPTGWVATGGIATLFQHFETAFHFGPPSSANGSDVIIRGSWNPSAIRQIVNSSDPELVLTHPIPWDQIPVQIPHAVEVAFSQDPSFDYFPTKITFFKFPNPDQPDEVAPFVTLNFDSPQPLTQPPDRLFVIHSSNHASVDVTDQYIARFQDPKPAANSTTRKY